VQALTEPGAEQQAGAGGAAGPQAGPTPQRTASPTATNQYNVGQTGTASGTSLNISEELSTQPVDTAPKAVLVGNAKIIADQRANTIIVLGSREVVVKIEKILDEMDVKAPQVALATVIGELTLNQDEEFGVNYFIRANKKYALTTNFPPVPSPFAGGGTTVPAPSPGGTPTTTGGSIFDPGNLLTFTQLATNAAAGTNIYLAAGATLASVVHALDSTGRFRVISRPMVFTSNNKKAIIANGQEVPVPVNTLSNAQIGTTAAVQSSIEFKKVALQLEVVPLINSEKEVSLDILQKIDSVVPGSNVNIGGNSVPTIATRYIRTNVSAPNCSTIVLGGLITDNTSLQKNGIPYLSRLPLVGTLFRSTTKNKARTELIVLMRPEVTLTKLDLYRLRQKSEDRSHFGPELEQDDCPDCPKRGDGKQLPPPDIPSAKDVGMR
jgi:general secretion pathway protein D